MAGRSIEAFIDLATHSLTESAVLPCLGEARQEARRIISTTTGLSRTDLLDKDRSLTDADWARAEQILARRLAREPISRIEGKREFWGLEFALNSATLDPRPDSETLIETVLKAYPDRAAPLRLLDLGTGSGCLLLALLHEYPQAEGVGIDLAPRAVAQAAANAATLELASRARLIEADFRVVTPDAVGAPFDLIVSNPPYIRAGDIAGLDPEVRLHDPLLALDGGVDGLAAYRVLAAAMPKLLTSGGRVFLEIGFDQAQSVTDLLAAEGFTQLAVAQDLNRHDRVVHGVCRGRPA